MRRSPSDDDRVPARTLRRAVPKLAGTAAACAVAATLVLAGTARAETRAATGHRGVPASRGPASISGTASVAYAGSIQDLSDKVVGPAFTQKTGYAYEGRGAGADALSEEIASGEITPNVFESIGAAPITALEPKFTSWYVQFAASPIVVAYNPASKYAPELHAIAISKEPISKLFALMATPGFKLGRTDPNVDPQGAAFIEMVELAQKTLHLRPGAVHAILGSGALDGSSSSEIFDETALEPRLEAGQLDAASAYLSQAVQLHLHYVELPESIDFGNPADASAYGKISLHLAGGKVEHGRPLVVDITTIGATDTAAADAFVAYALSPAGLAEYKAGGYTLLRPTLSGARANVPASVLSELPS